MSKDKENPKLVETLFDWGIANRSRQFPSAAKCELPTMTQLRYLERKLLDSIHKYNKWGLKGEGTNIGNARKLQSKGAWRKSAHHPIKIHCDTPTLGTERIMKYLDGTSYDPESKCHGRIKMTMDMDLYSRMIVGWKAEFEPFPGSGPKQ